MIKAGRKFEAYNRTCVVRITKVANDIIHFCYVHPRGEGMVATGAWRTEAFERALQRGWWHPIKNGLEVAVDRMKDD